MYRRLAAIGLLLLSAPLWGAELKLVGEAVEHRFVTVTSDKGGQWLVLGPNAAVVLESTNLAGTPVLGKPKLNRASSFTTDGGKGVIFVGAPGFYAVTQWGIEGEAEPSVLVVEIRGGVVPVPVPPTPVPPTPVPPTPVPPDPTPAGSRSLRILRETANTTPSLARLINNLRTGPSEQYLKSKSHDLLILDVDVPGSDGKIPLHVQAWKQETAGLQLPVLVIFDPKTSKTIYKGSISEGSTDASVLEVLKQHGG